MVTFDICKGNPGALTFVMLAYEYNPYRAEAAFRRMQNNGITGDKLYMLWNDCCDRDVEQALVNMECMSMEEIVSHINYEGGRGIPIPKKENLWWLRSPYPRKKKGVPTMSSEKGRRFSHLRWKDRLKIERMLKEGHKVKEIAAALHVDSTTIYREIKRGKTVQRTTELIDREIYCPDVAENKYRANLAAKGPALKLGNDYKLAAYIEQKIVEERYSPEAVLLKIKEERLTFSVTLSKWTLYSYITKGVFLGVTNKSLPRKGKKKNKGYRKVRAAHLPQGDSIEDRPEEIAERAMPGDWEMDTVVSCKKDAARLLVLTERMFRQEIIIKMPDGTTQSVVRSLDRLERKLGSRMFRRIFRTITVDNGSEFADCEGMERSCLTKRARTHIYYCHPYSAFERGSNENANSLIRRWLPKGTKLSEVSQAEIKQIQIWMNNYPRMVLGGRCANTALAEWMAAEGVLLPFVHI